MIYLLSNLQYKTATIQDKHKCLFSGNTLYLGKPTTKTGARGGDDGDVDAVGESDSAVEEIVEAVPPI